MAKDATTILHARYAKGSPAYQAALRIERLNADVAVLVYDARQNVGLTQSELAMRVGTTQSVISRLEDAEYCGHSLLMLYRVAEAVGKRVEVRFLDG